MPRRLAVVVLAVLAALLSPGPAWAAPLPTDAGVWLDGDPPGTAERVGSAASVTGRAQIPEGILRIELHVVAAGETELGAPVDTLSPTPLGIGTVPFTVEWVPASAGRVDVHVVAVGLLRSVAAVVRGVVVEPAAPARVRLPSPPEAAAPPAPGSAPVAAAPRRRVRDRAGVYLGGYGELAYPRPPAAAAVLSRSSAASPIVSGDDPAQAAQAVAAGLLLVLVSAHVHRVLRATPSSSEGLS